MLAEYSEQCIITKCLSTLTSGESLRDSFLLLDRSLVRTFLRLPHGGSHDHQGQEHWHQSFNHLHRLIKGDQSGVRKGWVSFLFLNFFFFLYRESNIEMTRMSEYLTKSGLIDWKPKGKEGKFCQDSHLLSGFPLVCVCVCVCSVSRSCCGLWLSPELHLYTCAPACPASPLVLFRNV